MIKAILIGLALLSTARAATKYVAKSAAGSNDGSSAGNAYSIAQLNAASPFSPAAGDTVILTGTFDTTALTVPTSGSAGNVITYRFDSGAKFSKGTWGNSAAAITISGKSYITIDGAPTGTIGGYGAAGTLNGIIECTSNGTGLTTTDDAWGVRIFDSHDVTVQGLTVRNMYVRTRGTDTHDGGAGVSARYNASNVYNLTVTNCVFSDMQSGLFLTYGPSTTGITYSYCTAYNVNWGGGAGDAGATSALSGLSVHHNYFHDFINWDGTDSTSQGLWHHNGFYVWGDEGSGGTCNDVTFHSNVFGPNWSTGAFNSTTAGIFCTGSKMLGPVLIYNNVFLDDNTSNTPSNGHIKVWPAASATRIYNNTFVGPTTADGIAIGYDGAHSGTKTLDIKNNVVLRKTGVSVFNNSVTLTADHDVYYSLKSGEEFNWSNSGASDFKTLTQWKAIGGAFDPDAVTTTPNLNGSYIPQPTSSAINAGTTLSSYFTTDIYGVTRPSGASWDIGAAEYVAAGGSAGSSAVGKVTLTGAASFK